MADQAHISTPVASFSVASTYGATDQQPIRWGLLGTGKIAEDFANALAPCKDIVLQAIGSRSIQTANSFADIFNIPNRHGSYESLVADPTVDVIWIGTPDACHGEHAKLALNAGKPVLVEKPFCANLSEAEEVYELSKEKQLFCMEGMWTRFVPSMMHTLNLITAGTIGAVKLVQSDFGCKFPIPAGALNALGVYNLALHHMVYDQHTPNQKVAIPSELYASGTLRLDGMTDDQVGGILQFSDSQLSTFTASLLVNSPNEAIIVGEKGRIRLLGPLWHSTNKIIVELEGEKPKEVGFEGFEDVKFIRPFNLLNSERLVYEALEVNRCIRSNLIESPHWRHEQSTQVMKEMEQIRDNIRKRKSAN